MEPSKSLDNNRTVYSTKQSDNKEEKKDNLLTRAVSTLTSAAKPTANLLKKTRNWVLKPPASESASSRSEEEESEDDEPIERKQTTIEHLPIELFGLIFSELDERALLAAKDVNKRWKPLAEHALHSLFPIVDEDIIAANIFQSVTKASYQLSSVQDEYAYRVFNGKLFLFSIYRIEKQIKISIVVQHPQTKIESERYSYTISRPSLIEEYMKPIINISNNYITISNVDEKPIIFYRNSHEIRTICGEENCQFPSFLLNFGQNIYLINSLHDIRSLSISNLNGTHVELTEFKKKCKSYILHENIPSLFDHFIIFEASTTKKISKKKIRSILILNTQTGKVTIQDNCAVPLCKMINEQPHLLVQRAWKTIQITNLDTGERYATHFKNKRERIIKWKENSILVLSQVKSDFSIQSFDSELNFQKLIVHSPLNTGKIKDFWFIGNSLVLNMLLLLRNLVVYKKERSGYSLQGTIQTKEITDVPYAFPFTVPEPIFYHRGVFIGRKVAGDLAFLDFTRPPEEGEGKD